MEESSEESGRELNELQNADWVCYQTNLNIRPYVNHSYFDKTNRCKLISYHNNVDYLRIY